MENYDFADALIVTAPDGRRFEAVAEDTNGLLVCVPIGVEVLRLQTAPDEPETTPAVEAPQS